MLSTALIVVKDLKKLRIDHFIFFLIGSTYFCFALASSPLAYKEIFDNIEFYFSILIPYLVSFIFVFWATKSIVFLFKNSADGLIGLSKCWQELRVDYLSKETFFRFLMIFPLIPFFNFSYSSLKQTIPITTGNTLDPSLHKIDLLLHGGYNPWDFIQPIFGHPFITRVIDHLYIYWGSLFLCTLVWMTFTKRQYLRLQFFLSLMFCWIILGNIMARILTSAGPCYFTKVVTSASDPYVNMMVYLRSIPDLKAVQIQDGLWQAHINGVFMPLGGISAMPSMHVSIAVLLALVFFRVNIYMGILFSLFAIIIQIGSVHLGWHYAVDGYLSCLLTIFFWKGAEKILPFIKMDPANFQRH